MTGAGHQLLPARRGRGFSVVETVISTVIVGVMLVAALNTVGGSRLTHYKMRQRCQARHLAEALMAEILQQDYEEPADLPVFGAEPSESTGSRATFDDVDDYHRWSASPPQEADGTDIQGLDGWKREVTVRWTTQDDFGSFPGSDMGVKRIDVEVSYKGAAVLSVWAVRTRNDQYVQE